MNKNKLRVGTLIPLSKNLSKILSNLQSYNVVSIQSSQVVRDQTEVLQSHILDIMDNITATPIIIHPCVQKQLQNFTSLDNINK